MNKHYFFVSANLKARNGNGFVSMGLVFDNYPTKQDVIGRLVKANPEFQNPSVVILGFEEMTEEKFTTFFKHDF